MGRFAWEELYMKIVVSACLMGESCKYNGLDNYHRELVEACERTGTEVLLVCPEVFGGLPTGSVAKVGVRLGSRWWPEAA